MRYGQEHRTLSDPEMIEKLLITCVAMGLLEKTGTGYKNTELSETYLVAGRPLYQGNIIAHAASVWRFWDTLAAQTVLDAKEWRKNRRYVVTKADSVKTGTRNYGRINLACNDLSDSGFHIAPQRNAIQITSEVLELCDAPQA